MPLIVMAMTAQVVNVGLMTLFFHFDGRDVRRIVTPSYALSDLIFVPAGVLAAVLYNTDSTAVFVLFAGLMLLLVLSFNTHRDAPRSGAGRATRRSRDCSRPAWRCRARAGSMISPSASWRRRVPCSASMKCIWCSSIASAACWTSGCTNEIRFGCPRRLMPIDAGLFGWLVSRWKPLVVKDWRDAPPELLQRAEATEKATGSLLAVPLVNDGIALGLLSVQHREAGTYADADLHLMRQLGEQIAGALADARAFEDLENYRRHLEERVTERTAELEKANSEKERLITMLRERSLMLERESQEDPLTGVANRRCFMQRLASEIEVALAVGQPLSIAIADLDHFKVVNDELGHPVGDQALRQTAALMLRGCRHSDLVARIGGEEFALILPGMTRADATVFCETLRAAVADHDWRRGARRPRDHDQHRPRAVGWVRRTRRAGAHGRCAVVPGQARGQEPGGVTECGRNARVTDFLAWAVDRRDAPPRISVPKKLSIARWGSHEHRPSFARVRFAPRLCASRLPTGWPRSRC